MPSDTSPASRFEQVLAWSVAVVMLVVSCLLGYLTTYVFLIVVVVLIAYVLVRRGVDWTPDPMATVFLAAFVILAVLFAITARRSDDALAAFNFSAFFIYLPVAVLLARVRAGDNARWVALLCLLGVGLACALSLIQVYGLGAMGAGIYITDRIRLANTAVLLAFMAPAMGIPVSSGPQRWLFLLAIPFAAVVVLLAGARIAMVAFPVLVLVLSVVLARRKLLGALVGLALVAAIVVIGITGLGNTRLQLLLAAVTEVAQSGTSSEDSVYARLMLYQAGWTAFQQSPWVGYGWNNMMPVAGAYLPAGAEIWARLPHLHNDLLTFAVVGGIPGALVYLVLLLAPLFIVRRSPRDSQYEARRNGVAVLVAGYAVMGTTDTMIGFETHTALYVGLLALILSWCRDPKPEPSSVTSA
jgi:O-antigen ligase